LQPPNGHCNLEVLRRRGRRLKTKVVAILLVAVIWLSTLRHTRSSYCTAPCPRLEISGRKGQGRPVYPGADVLEGGGHEEGRSGRMVVLNAGHCFLSLSRNRSYRVHMDTIICSLCDREATLVRFGGGWAGLCCGKILNDNTTLCVGSPEKAIIFL
jgi:hypothetical protein